MDPSSPTSEVQAAASLVAAFLLSILLHPLLSRKKFRVATRSGTSRRNPHFVFCAGREWEDPREKVEGSTFLLFFLRLKRFGEFPLYRSHALYLGNPASRNPAPAVGSASFPLRPRVRVWRGWRGRTHCTLTFPIHGPPESGRTVLGTCSSPFCARRGHIFFQPSLSSPHLHSWLEKGGPFSTIPSHRTRSS